MFSFSCHQPEFLFYEKKENVFGSTASIHMRGCYEVKRWSTLSHPFPAKILLIYYVMCNEKVSTKKTKQNKTP